MTLNNNHPITYNIVSEGPYVFGGKSNLYRVILTGNIEEILIGETDKETAGKLMTATQATARQMAFGTNGIKSLVRLPTCPDPLYQLPFWQGVDTRFHICGVVVDDDLRATVEDSEGNELYDITWFIRTMANCGAANDNLTLYELGDYNGLKTSAEISDAEATAGLFNARTFEKGMFTYVFEAEDGFDPWKVFVPLQDLTTHHLTTEVLYDGFPALDVDTYRWTVNPPQISAGFLKAA